MKSPFTLERDARQFADIDNKHASLQGELERIVNTFYPQKLYVNKQKVNINHEVRKN